MRDLRDPQQVGAEYLELRAEGCDMDTAVTWAYAASTDVAPDQTCIEKYGSAYNVEPRVEEIRIR